MQRNQIFIIGIIVALAAIILIKPQIKNNQIKDISADAQAIASSCQKQSDWRACYGDQLAAYDKNHQFKDTVKVLNALEEVDSKTRDCHLLAHKIATSEVEKNPSKWLDIFNVVDQTTCTNGFVHGVLEGRSRFEANFEINASIIPQICQQIEEKTSQRLGIEAKGPNDNGCAHVLGHILLAQNNGDIEKSADECQKLEERVYKKSCLYGVFMENITRDNLAIHTNASRLPMTQASADQINTLCKKFDDGPRGACFRELAHLYTIIEKNDPIKVYADCYQAVTEEEGKECYFHAINLMILVPKFNSQKLINVCVNFSNESDLKNCILRSLDPLFLSSVKFNNRAITFCLNVKENMRNFCFRVLGERLKRLEKDDNQRLNLCLGKVPEQYLNLCAGIKKPSS